MFALGSSTAPGLVSLLKNPPQQDKFKICEAPLLITFEFSETEQASWIFSLQETWESTSPTSSLSDCFCDSFLLRYGILWPTLPSLTAMPLRRPIKFSSLLNGTACLCFLLPKPFTTARRHNSHQSSSRSSMAAGTQPLFLPRKV